MPLWWKWAKWLNIYELESFGRDYDSIENMQLPEIPTVIKMLINDSFFLLA